MDGTTWSDDEAGSSDIEQLAYAVRRLARTAGLSLRGAAYASLKSVGHNLFGENEDLLYFSQDRMTADQAAPGDFTSLRLADLVQYAALADVSAEPLSNALAASRLDFRHPIPDKACLLHAIFQGCCILTARPDALLAIALADNGRALLETLFEGSIVIFEGAQKGESPALAWQTITARHPGPIKGLLLPGYDLAVMGNSPRDAYNIMVEVALAAEDYLKEHSAWEISLPTTELSDRPWRVEIAGLRKTLSDAAGCPLILTVDSSPVSLNFARWSGQRAAFDSKTVPFEAHERIPGENNLLAPWPMIGQDISAYRENHGLSALEAAPRLTFDTDLGMITAGRTAAEAAAASELYLQAIQAFRRAQMLSSGTYNKEGWQGVDALLAVIPEKHFNCRYYQAVDHPSFTGEVALVTGGASGIGKACVESLLQRGAAVVTLDLNPGVVDQFNSDAYLGLVCDLTDEAAVLDCYETFCRRFGGLDMLVLNAGIFPAGVRIEALETAVWQKVMRINLDSNLVVMRETHPLLKTAPRYGRVLVNASKNVLAPGAGAAAYSSSKAAVTQLARVAALEWGKDGIRVNMVHPDAIFDTGIWTEEVLKARAAHYGMTVQQYKTRNVLGVELNSHYVGELVAEMLGPLFEKITGAQIPVDGGSDRVI